MLHGAKKDIEIGKADPEKTNRSGRDLPEAFPHLELIFLITSPQVLK